MPIRRLAKPSAHRLRQLLRKGQPLLRRLGLAGPWPAAPPPAWPLSPPANVKPRRDRPRRLPDADRASFRGNCFTSKRKPGSGSDSSEAARARRASGPLPSIARSTAIPSLARRRKESYRPTATAASPVLFRATPAAAPQPTSRSLAPTATRPPGMRPRSRWLHPRQDGTVPAERSPATATTPPDFARQTAVPAVLCRRRPIGRCGTGRSARPGSRSRASLSVAHICSYAANGVSGAVSELASRSRNASDADALTHSSAVDRSLLRSIAARAFGAVGSGDVMTRNNKSSLICPGRCSSAFSAAAAAS